MQEGVILSFLIGLILGAIIIWFLTRNIKKENEILSRKVDEGKVFLTQSDRLVQELKTEIAGTREENKMQNAKLSSLATSNQHLQEAMLKQGKDIESSQKKHQEELEKSQERLKLEFENLSNKILDKNSKKLTEQSKNDLDQILKPFRENIKKFEDKVDNKNIQDARDRAQLIEKIKQLSDLNESMRKDAKNLTSALKGDSQKQGNWGELVLERVLEHSGLVKGQEYYTQVHAESEEGKRHRPDVIVNLPENKHLIIDSKVSLTAYEQAIATDDPEERDLFIKKHMISIKNHIKELNIKNYQLAKGIDSPDFVLMFMPIEASFSLAVKEDVSIYNYAWDRKVVIVSPSTLLATLKTISSLWKQEKQNQNAIEIATQAGALYDKFVGFTEDLIKVGRQLDTTTKTYQDSMKKLTDGTGNLVRRAEKIKALGAKASKSVDVKLKERAGVAERQKEKEID